MNSTLEIVEFTGEVGEVALRESGLEKGKRRNEKIEEGNLRIF